MQVPIRKPGKYTHDKPDPHLTEEKLYELKKNLESLKKIRPEAASEVSRLAEMGDFSENAAYQMAKGRLRGINQKILDLEDHLKRAVIIQPMKDMETLQLGHTVTIDIEGKKHTYLMLGSTESDPIKGIISHNSPIGSALMGHKIGDRVRIYLKNKQIECIILSIK